MLDVDLASLNDALELCVYTFTSQILMKVSQNSDNHQQLCEIAEVAKNMVTCNQLLLVFKEFIILYI